LTEERKKQRRKKVGQMKRLKWKEALMPEQKRHPHKCHVELTFHLYGIRVFFGALQLFVSFSTTQRDFWLEDMTQSFNQVLCKVNHELCFLLQASKMLMANYKLSFCILQKCKNKDDAKINSTKVNNHLE